MSRITTEEYQHFVLNTPAKWQRGYSESTVVDRDGFLSLTPMHNITRLEKFGYASDLTFGPRGDLYVIEALNCHIFKYNISRQTLKRFPCACPGYQITDASLESLKAAGLPGDVLTALTVIKDTQFPDKNELLHILNLLLGYERTVDYGAVILEHSCLENCGVDLGQFKFRPPLRRDYAGGLAFGKSTLYVADTYNHRLQAFYLPNFQLRFVLGRMENHQPVSGNGEGEFKLPEDVVADSRGNFYVLDRGNKRIQNFNHRGKFITLIGDRDGALKTPGSIAIDREDAIFVLDLETLTVEKFNNAGEHLGTVIDFDREGLSILPTGLAVDDKGLVYVGEQRRGSTDRDLHIYQFDKNGRWIAHFGRYSTACYSLAVDRKGRLFAACDSDVFLFNDGLQFEKEGVYYSPVFDSTIEACEWHRLTLEMTPAEKANLTIFFRASDNYDDLQDLQQTDPWNLLLSAPHNSVEITDALFSNAIGRYLRLKLAFNGDGVNSYRIKAAQVFFQRLSYLRYLPAVYQEDDAGRDFLERYLSIFETMNLEIENQIDGITRYFDPQAVDGEFLDWLGTWLAVLKDENWPEEKRKKLLQNAYQLYRKRGTLDGLQEIISLFTGEKTTIIEHYRLKTPMVLRVNSRIGQSTVIGKGFPTPLIVEETSRINEFALKEAKDPPQAPFAENAFDFTILADTSQLANVEQQSALQRLVEEEKPAHTRGFLRTGQKAVMQLGVRNFLAVDTKLSRGWPSMRLGLTSHLSKGTFVGTTNCHRGVISIRSKINIDTILH